MKLIKHIIEQMEEELEGAEEYIECAMKHKLDYPNIASMYYEMSLTEITHFEKLHSAAVTLINEAKARGEQPTAEMQAIYDYEHEKAMHEATKIKVMQETYKR